MIVDPPEDCPYKGNCRIIRDPIEWELYGCPCAKYTFYKMAEKERRGYEASN